MAACSGLVARAASLAARPHAPAQQTRAGTLPQSVMRARPGRCPRAHIGEGQPPAPATRLPFLGFPLLLRYPDLWANTLPICRPDAAPNKNFVSDW